MVIRATRRSSRSQGKGVPSFLSYFKTLSIGLVPAPQSSALPTELINPARSITIKFRIRKETSKPQTNYHCCLRFSYLVPYWLISRNTITCHKYFWCWNWKGLPRNGKVSTIGTYRFHELKLQAVSGHASIIGPGIIRSGTRSFLTVTETLAGTLVGLKKHLTASKGQWNWESWYEDAYSQTPISTTGKRTAEGTVISSNTNNALDRTLPLNHVLGEVRDTPITKNYGGLRWFTNSPAR